MKILYFGGGFVGTCSAAVSADSGHKVLVYDINQALVKMLSSGDKDEIESCLFEKGLGEILMRNKARIDFTSDISVAARYIEDTEAVFMCLPTPEKDATGETNLIFYEKAAEDLAGILKLRNGGEQKNYVLIINKSTVPIEMVDRTKEIMEGLGVRNYGIGANPEFLVEGKAIEGSIKPARIVVGAWTEGDFAIFRNIYKRFHDSPNVEYIEVNPFEAAAAKLLANYLLFSRLVNSYDVVGRVCENFENVKFENIRRILIADQRIGGWGFYDSLFAGGSCFIKDSRSLAYQLESKGAAADLVKNALAANQRQLDNFLARAKDELDFDWRGKTVALLGLAFKRDTNDVRNSGSLGVADFLIKQGVAKIQLFDPVAGGNFLKYFADSFSLFKLAASEAEVLSGAEVMIISTDWPQFRELKDAIKDNLPQGSLIMDGRRLLEYKYQELAEAGYDIIAVGSPLIRK